MPTDSSTAPSGKNKPIQKRQKGTSGVTETQLNFWTANKGWGDFKKIKVATGLSRPTINDAFSGIATSDVAEKITDYYIQKTTSHES